MRFPPHPQPCFSARKPHPQETMPMAGEAYPSPADYAPIPPRARIGFIIPSSNRMVEPQMSRFAPQGVEPHFQRLRMTNKHKRPLPELMPSILSAVEHLMDSNCDIIVFQCTGTSMSGGVDMDKHVVREIAATAKRPAISTAAAVNAALAALGAKRLVFISE